MQKLSITCTNGAKFCVEGVSYVLSDIPACLFKDCQSAWDVRLRFASGLLAKTEGRDRILIPATTAIFAPRISNWTRLEGHARVWSLVSII